MSYISFPGLGIENLPISDTIVDFSLFGLHFSIKWYGLFIAVGFILAIIYAMKRADFFKIDPDRMIDVVLVSTISAFIGARLYYVLFSDDTAWFFEKPIRLLQVWEGGLAIYGGIIFAFVTALIMCKVRKVNVWSMFDMGGLGFLIGQGIGRWGNFFNQEAYGALTRVPWRMNGSRILYEYISTENSFYDMYAEEISKHGYTAAEKMAGVHPTFLYESLWCIAGFILLHFLSKKFYKFKGQIFCGYIVWYGLGRAIIEGLRTDSLYLGQMRVSQLVAILSVIGGIILYFVLRSKDERSPIDLFAQPETANDNILETLTFTIDITIPKTEFTQLAEKADDVAKDNEDDKDKSINDEDANDTKKLDKDNIND